MLRPTALRAFVLAMSAASIVLALTPATEPSSTTQSGDGAAAKPLVVGSAVLLSRAHHLKDRGTFLTFARGQRGGNDDRRRLGDMVFDGTRLTVQKHTGDKSTIVDLGELSWQQVDTLPREAATGPKSAEAIAGHVYLVHLKDTVADYFALVRMVAVTRNDRCEVEWVRLDHSMRPEPVLEAPVAERLAGLLRAQDLNVDEVAFLQKPRVMLQVRAGAGGGNPNRIDMAGETSIYIDEVSSEPLIFDRAVTMDDPAVAYSSGGRIRPGKCFVVQRIRYSGSARGDSNGHGALILNVGTQKIFEGRDMPGSVKDQWEGRIEIRAGEEQDVYVEVANTSEAAVILEGELIDDPAGHNLR